jgi:hypothetical protein
LFITLEIDALGSNPHGEHHFLPKAFTQLAQRLKSFGVRTDIVQKSGMFPLNWPYGRAIS